jgi:hypothetical protein
MHLLYTIYLEVFDMTEEKELKKEGEELAKLAVESGMGSKQLQIIYKLVKIRSMPFVQAFIQKQIGRGVSGVTAFAKVLELSEKYEDRKVDLEKILMYAVMLYDYFEAAPTMKLRIASEGIVRNVVTSQGFVFEGLEIESAGNRVDIRVNIRGFHGNRKALAMEIEKALKSKVEGFRDIFLRVWIE